MQNLILECQVLEHILKERQAAMEGLTKQLMPKLTISPELYVLKVNFQKDEWLLELKQGALIVPGSLPMNREQKRALRNN